MHDVKKLKENLSNCRKLCLELPEGVYLLGEYLSKVISAPHVTPEELSVFFVCTLIDLNNGRNGFPHVKDKDFAEFSKHKAIILRDAIYFSRLVSSITNEEFTDRFCSLCRVTLGFTFPDSRIGQKPKWKDWKIAKLMDRIFEW